MDTHASDLTAPEAGRLRLLEDVVALASEAIISVDETHRIVLFNRGAEEIFGYGAEEVIGRPLSLLVPTPAGDAHGEQMRRFGAGAAAMKPKSHRGEIAGRRKSGEIFPAEASISKHEVDGRRIYTSILRDISERKRRESELRLLQTIALEIGAADDLESALRRALQEVVQATGWATGEAWLPDGPDGHLVRGPEWTGSARGLEAFHAASEGFHFAPGEGLVGRVWASGEPLWVHDLSGCAEFIRRDVARELGLSTAMIIPVLAREEVVAVLAFYHFRERGGDHHLLGLVTTVASQLGALVQRKRAESAQAALARALAQQAAELARSNAELEQFAYVASHDLQEPLRMVASYTELLARRYGDRLDGDAKDFIGFAVEGVQRMRALINDLLAYSRTGTRGGEPKPTDMEAVLARVLQNLGPAIEESGARVTHDPLPIVPADALQMGQLLQNLVGNALKFQRPGVAPRVHISARSDGDGWDFSVKDNGIGIEPEFAERIFVIFQRLHSRAEYPGTGIGLAICRKIVERHGGHIRVESSPGEGTTFLFSLPAAPLAA